jgi:ABC-type dipeptide/oligopeptide/nickel transport system permease subunit
MKRMVAWTLSTILSGLLGWAGMRYSLMTGFILGMIGTGLGLFLGARLAERWGAE